MTAVTRQRGFSARTAKCCKGYVIRKILTKRPMRGANAPTNGAEEYYEEEVLSDDDTANAAGANNSSAEGESIHEVEMRTRKMFGAISKELANWQKISTATTASATVQKLNEVPEGVQKPESVSALRAGREQVVSGWAAVEMLGDPRAMEEPHANYYNKFDWIDFEPVKEACYCFKYPLECCAASWLRELRTFSPDIKVVAKLETAGIDDPTLDGMALYYLNKSPETLEADLNTFLQTAGDDAPKFQSFKMGRTTGENGLHSVRFYILPPAAPKRRNQRFQIVKGVYEDYVSVCFTGLDESEIESSTSKGSRTGGARGNAAA